jgi:eukaryotic-like serine/threonine-protein kinase
VILRSCDWQNTRFGKLQVLPTDGKAIKGWSDIDEAFTDVVKGLRRSIKQLTSVPNPPNLVGEPEEHNKPPLQSFSFKTVRLNEQGKVVERQQIRGFNRFIEDLGGGVQLAMMEIPAGKFLMGAPSDETLGEPAPDPEMYNLDFERPQHWVQVPRFYLGQTLITQGQWKALMERENPSYFKGDDNLPVECVSWLDSIEFCEKLSTKTGRNYRLPTEAEWEYACRAGSEKPFAFGESITPEFVNYDGGYPYGKAESGESCGKTTLVDQFLPNSFSLYDMHGNLWEWCLDEGVDNYNNAPLDGSARGDINSRNSDKIRVVRGGSWLSDATYCRSAVRSYITATSSYRHVGLRVVAVPASTPSRQSSYDSRI